MNVGSRRFVGQQEWCTLGGLLFEAGASIFMSAPRTEASRRTTSNGGDSQNHNLTPPVYVRRRDGRDQTARAREAERDAGGGLGRLGLGARRLLGEEDERLARRRPDQP